MLWKKTALDHMGFSLTEGVYGLLGPNGAGKSTLINIISSNMLQTSGHVYWNGTDILKLGSKYRAILGFMPQQQALYPTFTGQEFLDYMAALQKLKKFETKNRIEEILDLVQLSEVGNQKISTYSGGMKQRLLLAQALLSKPELLILDEPTAGLDPKQRIYMRNLLKEIGKTCIVLIATHVVSDVDKIAKEILMISNGKLIEKGNPMQLINKFNVNTKNLTTPICSLEDVYLHCYGEELFETDLL
ncbi:hypothetical protein P261_02902 [Lachnospiraceae bacterium TWA4]|nr:hypothetical protein P261_02902 [Lachnospiraceae bacterium TWA4]